MRCDCGCGALWFGDLDPELYRTAAALISAYTFGDLEAFDELFDAAPRQIVKVLVAGIYAAIGVVAEERGWSMADCLGVFCRSAESMAADSEAMP
jgi:glutamate-1-semialdehyde aminotransferase